MSNGQGFREVGGRALMQTMSTTPTTFKQDEPLEAYAAFVGIDWADREHAWCLQVAGQSQKQTGTLEQKPEAISSWVAKLRERFGGRYVAIAVEQSRGALIHALMSYD